MTWDSQHSPCLQARNRQTGKLLDGPTCRDGYGLPYFVKTLHLITTRNKTLPVYVTGGKTMSVKRRAVLPVRSALSRLITISQLAMEMTRRDTERSDGIADDFPT